MTQGTRHIGTTLTNYIIETQRQMPEATGEFSGLLNDIAVACKRISDFVNKGDLIGMLGSAASENVQGETQKKLDVVTDEIFEEALTQNGHIAGMVTEEMDDVHILPSSAPRGSYLLLCDPLDGSSNIDVNISVGTIFSIVRAPEGREPTRDDFLKPGTEQVAAGYCLYGPSTILVLAVKGQGVQMFTLDRDFGEFILTQNNVQIPEDTNEFAINVSNQRHWEAPVKRYIDECLQGKEGPRGKDFNMRWVASMVAEVHRILCRGGLFTYPLDEKIKAKGQRGRLRLMYEANPMSLIIEQAGGAATTGRERILDIQPEEVHQRAAVVLGSKNEVALLTRYHNEG